VMYCKYRVAVVTATFVISICLTLFPVPFYTRPWFARFCVCAVLIIILETFTVGMAHLKCLCNLLPYINIFDSKLYFLQLTVQAVMSDKTQTICSTIL
jgi:hypothetical protein